MCWVQQALVEDVCTMRAKKTEMTGRLHAAQRAADSTLADQRQQWFHKAQAQLEEALRKSCVPCTHILGR